LPCHPLLSSISRHSRLLAEGISGRWEVASSISPDPTRRPVLDPALPLLFTISEVKNSGAGCSSTCGVLHSSNAPLAPGVYEVTSVPSLDHSSPFLLYGDEGPLPGGARAEAAEGPDTPSPLPLQDLSPFLDADLNLD
jgi:hypothetical protein